MMSNEGLVKQLEKEVEKKKEREQQPNPMRWLEDVIDPANVRRAKEKKVKKDE